MAIEDREYLEDLITLASQQADKDNNKLRLQIESMEENLKVFCKEQEDKDIKRWNGFKWTVGIVVVLLTTVSLYLDLRQDTRQDAVEVSVAEIKKKQELTLNDVMTKDAFRAEISEQMRKIDKEHTENLRAMLDQEWKRHENDCKAGQEELKRLLQEALRRR